MKIIAMCILVLGMSLQYGSANAMTSEQIKKVDLIIENNEISPNELNRGLEWLDSLIKENQNDDQIFGCKARLYFYRALLEDDKSQRIKKYQEAIDAADKGISINPRSTLSNFWKAAAVGKQ